MPKKSTKLSTLPNGNGIGSPQLSPINLAALRRCRPLLVKDLDVEELLRIVSASGDVGSNIGGVSDQTNAGTLNGIRWIESELRSPLLNVSDAEHRITSLLDSIESRADAVFSSFVDLLRVGDRNRKLYAVLAETLRALGGGERYSGDEDDGELDDCGVFADRTSVPGESIRRLLQRCAARQQKWNAVKTSGSQMINSSDSGESESKVRSALVDEELASVGDYVDCFTVATRGSRLQPEPWIRHAKATPGLVDTVSGSAQPLENTAVTTKDLVFRRLDRASLLTTSGITDLKVPPASFSSVYVVDFDYKFVPTQTAVQEPLPAPRLQSTATPDVSPTGKEDNSNDSKTRLDAVSKAEIPVPPLPPKPPELSLFGTQGRSSNRSTPRPPPMPAEPPVNDIDTESIDEPRIEAPPLPERKLRVFTSGKQYFPDDDRASIGSPKTDDLQPSSNSSPVSTRRDVVGGTEETESTGVSLIEDSTASNESESVVPPQLPPRLYAIGNGQSLPADETRSDCIASELKEIVNAEDNTTDEHSIRLPTVVVSVTSSNDDENSQPNNDDESAKDDGGCRYAGASSSSIDSTAQGQRDEPAPADSISSCSKTVSPPGGNEAGGDAAMSFLISQREDSGIGASSSTTGSIDESQPEADSIDIPIERQISEAFVEDDERTLLFTDDANDNGFIAAAAAAAAFPAASDTAAATIEVVTASSGSRRQSETADDGQGSFGSTVGGGSGDAMSSCVTGGLDSGVDSLQSLPRSAGNDSNGSYQRRDVEDGDRSADDGEDDDDVCDGDNLSLIRIPAGDDDDSDHDDDLDRRSEESISHYEDIELLPVENVYLDPRRPSESSTPYLSTGVTSSKRRRSEPTRNKSDGGDATVRYGYSYSYGRVTSSSASQRHEAMLAELEATDRKLLVAGSVLILDDQEELFESKSATNETGNTDLDQSLTRCFHRTKLAYDARCLAFYVPVDSLRNHGDPVGERWFYPVAMTPRDATIFLRAENQPGCFVVYSPPKPTSVPSEVPLYYLSVCLGNGGDVVHYRIIRNPRGDVSISGHDHSFLNVADLVSYFRRNRSGLAVRLGRPLADASRGFVESTWSQVANRYTLSRRELVLTSRSIRHHPTFQQPDFDVKFDDSGRFSKTYVGRYRSRPVAVSVMGRPDFSDSDHGASRSSSSFASRVDEFLEPALDVVAGLRHENVVRLIGISVSERPFYVVWEHSENGATLADRLGEGGIDGSGLGRLASDDVEGLFDICLQASAALAYLESQRFILHRDIAARSFTVIGGTDGTGGRLIKLSNFNRARKVCDDDYQAPLSETIFVRWAGPEVLAESRYSSKSDVWSLGVFFWEVFSGAATPYQHIDSMEQLALLIARGKHVSGNENIQLRRPTGPCPDDLWSVMRACWRHRPADRPSPGALYSRLRSGRSKIYAAITALDVTSATTSVEMRLNGSTQNGSSSGLPVVGGLVNRNRRAMPLPEEPIENGGGASFNSSYRFDHSGSASPSVRNRPTSDTPSAGKQWSALKDSNRPTSDHAGDNVHLVSPKTSVTLGHRQHQPLPSSPSWDTASMISSATLGYERGTSLRHSFMNRLLPNHKKKKKPGMTLNQTIEVTTNNF